MTAKRSLGRRITYGIIGSLFLLLIVLIIGEIGIRIYYASKPNSEIYKTAEKVAELGWQPKGNYLFDGELKDAAGATYPIHLTTNKNGFRQYGNPKTDKTKVFFLGDSYTQSVEVSDDKLFYNIIQDSLPIEVFAFGMAGYGQLQEYMILDKYYDEIQPDILVLQVCSNDFIDNHYKLEINSGYKVGLRRPYLTLEGEIEYHHPLNFHQKIDNYSKFLGFVTKRLHTMRQNSGAIAFAEKEISAQKRAYEPFDYSVKVTELALLKIKNRIGANTKLIVYNADHYEPQASEFKRLCEKHKIPYISAPTTALLKAEQNGIIVRAADAYHWNNKGHEIIGKAFLNKILD